MTPQELKAAQAAMDAARGEARTIVDRAQLAARDLTDDEQAAFDKAMTEAKRSRASHHRARDPVAARQRPWTR